MKENDNVTQTVTKKNMAIFLDYHFDYKKLVLINKALESFIMNCAAKMDEILSSDEFDAITEFKHSIVDGITIHIFNPGENSEPFLKVKNKGGEE